MKTEAASVVALDAKVYTLAAASGVTLAFSWICALHLISDIYQMYERVNDDDIELQKMSNEFESIIREFRSRHNLAESGWFTRRVERSAESTLSNLTHAHRDYTQTFAQPAVEVNQCSKCLSYTNSCPRGPPGPAGPPGHQGENGLDGIDGEDGAPGISLVYEQTEPGCITCQKGPPGPPGPIGNIGSIGPIGNPGEPGLPGESALDGVKGPIGDLGPPGIKGASGRAGLPGIDGTRGKGIVGRPGPPGSVGPVGPPGVPGVSAHIGAPGPEGLPGQHGVDGLHGLDGPTGEIGQRGEPGPDGQYCPCPHRAQTLFPSDNYQAPESRPRSRPAPSLPYDSEDRSPYDSNRRGGQRQTTTIAPYERRENGNNYNNNGYDRNGGRNDNGNRGEDYGERGRVQPVPSPSSGRYDRASFRRALLSRLEKKFGSSF